MEQSGPQRLWGSKQYGAIAFKVFGKLYAGTSNVTYADLADTPAMAEIGKKMPTDLACPIILPSVHWKPTVISRGDSQARWSYADLEMPAM
jgi:hypothetical protein